MVTTVSCRRRVRPCELNLHMTAKFVALFLHLLVYVSEFGDVVLVVGVGLRHARKWHRCAVFMPIV